VLFDREVTVRKHSLAAMMAALALVPALARAQSLGPFTSAEILPAYGHAAGVYLQGSDSNTGLLSQLRLSFYPGVDFGFQGGFLRQDSGGDNRTLLQVGADVRCAVLRASQGSIVDLALGGGFGINTGDGFSLLDIGPMAFVSRSFPMGQQGSVTPYAVAGLSFGTSNVNSDHRTDFSAPVNLGVEFKPSTAMSLAAEIQFRPAQDYRDDIGLALGVTFPF
jgi:hypothetical protein